MGLPIITSVGHILGNIGQGIREEGLLGAAKVIGKGLSKDWILGLATAFIPPLQGIAIAAGVAAVADLTGILDLKSEKNGGQQGQEIQAPNFELDWGT